jgi:hypothetical protein
MFTQQLIFMLPLVIILMIVAIFQAYLLIKVKSNYYLKFIGIPLILFVAFFAFKTMDSCMGYAYPTNIPSKFILLGYKVVENDKVKTIDLWLQSNSSKTRLYRIPYSEGMSQKLSDAMKESQKNAEVGEFNIRANGAHETDWTDNFKFYPFDIQRTMPKNPNP